VFHSRGACRCNLPEEVINHCVLKIGAKPCISVDAIWLHIPIIAQISGERYDLQHILDEFSRNSFRIVMCFSDLMMDEGR
jgi:hypothetical protein